MLKVSPGLIVWSRAKRVSWSTFGRIVLQADCGGVICRRATWWSALIRSVASARVPCLWYCELMGK